MKDILFIQNGINILHIYVSVTVDRDIPQSVTTKLLKKIECVDYEAITFDVFKSGVFTCCVLQGKTQSTYTPLTDIAQQTVKGHLRMQLHDDIYILGL